MTTIYDIAKAAGVTATTVSNVLRGKGSVSAATRARVMKFVHELGYTPNLVARSLINGRTGVIGFVVPYMDNLFYAEAIAAIERLAYAAGLRVFVTSLSGDDDEGRKLLRDLALRRVDGIIVNAGTISPEVIVASIGVSPPLVYCFWEGDELRVKLSVTADFVQGGQLAADHLLSLGHRRIGVIAHGSEADGESFAHYPRVKGFRQAFSQQGFSFDPALLQPGESSLEGGKAAGYQLLTLPERPTAIFATNDLMAIGAMSAAWELGLRVPQDLSVVGLDDISLACYVTPPLTTIAMDKVAIMSASLHLLLAAIEGLPTSLPPIFPMSLVIRGSTGPCSA